MSKKNTKSALEELNPDHIEVWQQGGLAGKTLGPLTGNEAMSFRSQLYRLRKKLRILQHPGYELARQASIKIVANANHHGMVDLIIYPSNIIQAMANAGITDSDDPPALD